MLKSLDSWANCCCSCWTADFRPNSRSRKLGGCSSSHRLYCYVWCNGFYDEGSKKERSPLMRLLLPAVLLLFLLITFFAIKNKFSPENKSLNPVELSVAKEHDGTDAFLTQVISGSGEG